MKVMILGAAGQIGKMVTDDLLTQTDFDLVLYGRNVSSRLSDKVSDRVLLVDGNFEEFDKIKENLVDVDAVYLNYVAGDDLIKPLVEIDRKSTRLNSSHVSISYAVFCLKKKNYEQVIV